MLRQKLLLIALLIGMISSSGCVTNGPASEGLTLKEYSKEFNDQLAKEMETAGPATVEVISDYYVLRRQIKAAK